MSRSWVCRIRGHRLRFGRFDRESLTHDVVCRRCGIQETGRQIAEALGCNGRKKQPRGERQMSNWRKVPGVGLVDLDKWKLVHSCPRCGRSIDADPNLRIDRVRAWLWDKAHKLNCPEENQ
jgi:hypothetical protein